MEFSEWEEKVSNISRKYSHFDLWIGYQNVKAYNIRFIACEDTWILSINSF